MLELLLDAKEQLQAFTHAVGVAAIEGLLELSATQVAGEPHPGKATPRTQTAAGPVRRHGHQKGVVAVLQQLGRIAGIHKKSIETMAAAQKHVG